MEYEALDIETIWDNNIAKPFSIAITDDNDVLYYQTSIRKIDSSDLIDFMIRSCKNNKIYYVHNLSFEMYCFIPYFNKYNISYNMISSDKNIYSGIITLGKKKIRFRCSYRLTLLPLKDLAKIADIGNKDIFPYKILTPKIKRIIKINSNDFNSYNEYELFSKTHGNIVDIFKILKNYCINDAIITKVSINKFWKIIIDGGLKINIKILTAAKLSVVNYFSNNFYIKKKIDLKYDRILRPYYFGGRTEVFGNPIIKDNQILHYDWSGMYAQCMSEKVLGGEIYCSDIVYNIDNPGFYFIEFYQNMEYPILPIRFNNKLIFANGTFKGWYWFEEIQLAIEYGVKILKIDKIIGAQYYDYFIKEFVDINNNIRSKGGLYKQIGKNNNNTFYGRLGMAPERFSEKICNNINVKYEKYEKVVNINNTYITYMKRNKSISNITIASSITSKARIKLYRGFMEVIKNGGRILYCDTDSIIAEFKKSCNVIDIKMGEVLFDSKNIDTVITDAVFAAPKTYALRYKHKDIVKIKGFNSNPSFNKFKWTFYNKGSITTTNKEWNKKDMILKIKNIVKTTSLYNLDKRKWCSDLKNTYPLNVPYYNEFKI